MPKFLVAPRIVLASASPRRQELLKKVVPDFEIDPADLDEEALTLEDPVLTAKKLARAKSAFVALRPPESWVIRLFLCSDKPRRSIVSSTRS